MRATPDLAYDLFAGARGWEADAEDLGLDVVGFELDDDACATSRAAGLHVVQDDVARLLPDVVALVFGRPEGLIGSPPCQLFSSAGKGAGRAIMAELLRAIADAGAGASDVVMARHRRELRRLLRVLMLETMPKARRAERNREADRMARNVSLVWQPARWATRLRPRWVALERSADDPARTVDTRADQWEVELVANAQPKAATRRADEPAPTIKGGHDTNDRRWRLRNGTHDHRAERADDEPAPTLHFGERLNTVTWAPDEDRDPERTVLDRRQVGGRDGQPVGPRPASAPAPTMTAEGLRGGRDVWRDEDDPEAPWARSERQGLNPELKRDDWPAHRPATVLQGDQRVFQPGGHHANDGRASDPEIDGRSKSAVRVSVQEAAILQSFPTDWPWQGTRTAQFQQIGNAVPPGLARPVLAAVKAPTDRARGAEQYLACERCGWAFSIDTTTADERCTQCHGALVVASEVSEVSA